MDNSPKIYVRGQNPSSTGNITTRSGRSAKPSLQKSKSTGEGLKLYKLKDFGSVSPRIPNSNGMARVPSLAPTDKFVRASDLRARPSSPELGKQYRSRTNSPVIGDHENRQDSVSDVRSITSMHSAPVLAPPITIKPLPLRKSDVDVSEETRNARTDRKIKDLEISNASLLAINQVLEKKLRRQAKEIEYLNDLMSKHNITGELLAMHDDDDEDISIDEESNETFSSLGIAIKESLDNDQIIDEQLSKQQAEITERMQQCLEFIETSQNISKTLRKCLMLSETLIQEGSKSINLTINPEDIKVGMKISMLTGDEDEDDSIK
jgi:hypothetical protein